MENYNDRERTCSEACDREPTAKERVENELSELSVKIVKLSGFLFSDKLSKAELSQPATCLLHEQLRCMQEYATKLQQRLAIWGKSDKELEQESREKCRPIGW